MKAIMGSIFDILLCFFSMMTHNLSCMWYKWNLHVLNKVTHNPNSNHCRIHTWHIAFVPLNDTYPCFMWWKWKLHVFKVTSKLHCNIKIVACNTLVFLHLIFVVIVFDLLLSESYQDSVHFIYDSELLFLSRASELQYNFEKLSI